jgi:hypothetical protein
MNPNRPRQDQQQQQHQPIPPRNRNGGGRPMLPGTPQALVQMRGEMNTAGSTRSMSSKSGRMGSSQLSDDDSVRVVVRIRPMNDNEKGREEQCVLEAQTSGKAVQVRTSGRESMKQYAFNMVSGPSTTQKQFFDGCGIKSLLGKFMK